MIYIVVLRRFAYADQQYGPGTWKFDASFSDIISDWEALGRVRAATQDEIDAYDAVNSTPGSGLDEAAVQALITAAVDNLVNSAPGALNTLKELADAINDDASFASAMTSALATKQATLVSGTNIKTVNGASVLGAGNLAVGGTQPIVTKSANFTLAAGDSGTLFLVDSFPNIIAPTGLPIGFVFDVFGIDGSTYRFFVDSYDRGDGFNALGLPSGNEVFSGSSGSTMHAAQWDLTGAMCNSFVRVMKTTDTQWITSLAGQWVDF